MTIGNGIAAPFSDTLKIDTGTLAQKSNRCAGQSDLLLQGELVKVSEHARACEPAVAAPRSTVEQVCASLSARILSHPFLVKCGDGTVSVGELRKFLVQHGKYSRYFTRYLCALISQLDDAKDVLRLAENLVEELGYASDARIPHSRIYAQMLERFDIRPEAHSVYPETQTLVDTMFMLCRQPGGIAGLGALCLGAEAIVPTTYARIMQGFRRHGVPDESLEFFAIHVHCDDDHARTMYSIIDRLVEQSSSHYTTMINAGEIAINARLRFFDALLRTAQ